MVSGTAVPASTRSFVTVFFEMPSVRQIDRIAEPSTSIDRISTRFSIGSRFNNRLQLDIAQPGR